MCERIESSQFKRVDKQRREKRNTRVIFEILEGSDMDASSVEQALHVCNAIYRIKKKQQVDLNNLLYIHFWKRI